MNTLEKLASLNGHGTSMITLTVATNPMALNNVNTLLNSEYNVATNIKSRV